MFRHTFSTLMSSYENLFLWLFNSFLNDMMELFCQNSVEAGKAQGVKKVSNYPCFIYHQSLGLNFPKLFINNKLATFLFFSSSLLTNKKKPQRVCFSGVEGEKKCFNDFVVPKETFNYVPLIYSCGNSINFKLEQNV
jgi:hypothetical protein